jgi:hypothetical protein
LETEFSTLSELDEASPNGQNPCRSKMKSAHSDPSPTLAAMRNLRAAGEKSFEALVARLLMNLSGESVRLCQAGAQGGVDAIADVPFAVEAKRHKNEVSARELLGGLAKAALKYRDLELWVLAATCTVGAQAANDLHRYGEEHGIGTMLLDTSPLAQLPAIGGITALAATDIDVTTKILADPSWQNGVDPPDVDAIRAELTAVRDQSAFAEWTVHLKTSLQDLPTWRRFVRSHNTTLRDQIISDARVNFVTPYDPAEAIPRDAESELSAWLDQCATTADCPIAVVVGERYDGKTWLVYRWLSENLPHLTLPVFFFSSDDVKADNGHVMTMIAAQVRHAMRSFSRHADAMIERQCRAANESSRPWCVVVLDGANEYTTDLTPFRKAVAAAVPVRPHDAKAALIVTSRRQDFETNAWWLENRPCHRIELGPFNEREFEQALARYSFSAKDIDEWAESARNLMRHPRYLGLAIHFWEELPLFGVVTADVLNFLDVWAKVIPRSPGMQLKPEALQAVLAGLAEEWLKQRTLDLKAVRGRVAEVTDHVDASVESIISRGVLSMQNGLLVLNPEQFEFGMGLLIRKNLLTTGETDFARALEELLQPHRSDDEKVRWLRAAVTTSAASRDEETRPEVLDFLVLEWISERNFSKSDLDDLRNLVPLILESVLRLLSSGKPVHKNMMAVAEPIIRAGLDRNETAVARAMRKWCRIIPAGAHWFIGDQGAAPPDVDRAPFEPSFRDLELCVADQQAGQSVRECQRLALSLAWERPTLIRPIDALALIATRRAVGGYLDEGERLAIRKILATSDAAWYQEEVAAWEGQPEASRIAVLRDLIDVTQRGDLAPLLASLPHDDIPTFRWRLSRKDLSELRAANDSKQILGEAEQAAHLPPDPECPPPSRFWRTAFERIAVERFAGSRQLHTGRSHSRDDFDLDHIEPALAAWAPKAGVLIWRAFFDDIPRRIEGDDLAWSEVIGSHLTLMTASQCRRLLDGVLLAQPKVKEMNYAHRRGYACVVAKSSASKRVSLLLAHPFEGEWHNLYEPLALGHDEALQQQAIAAVRGESDPLRRKRSRFLLVWIGGMDLTTADIQPLITDIADDDGIAMELLKKSRLAPGTPPDALAPLTEVAHELTEIAFQYDAFLLSRKEGMRGIYASGVVRALSAPKTARANGAADDISDEAAVMQGLQQLAFKITEHLSDPKSTMGRSEQFPRGLAAEVPREAFERWVQLLLSSPVYAHFLHSGLLLPVVRHALETAHPKAVQLWELTYPFHRGQPTGTRFVNEGLDSALCDLHDPAVDDDTARTILRDLIRDARSNSELIQIALAARIESLVRLTSVVDELELSEEEFDRARARYLAGWMPDNANLRARLITDDPSRWVKAVGEEAIHRLDRERWARHWLGRFLSKRRAEHRWAAGRLFAACSDAATPFWARDMIWNASGSTAIQRAEASLLLDTIRKKPDDSELRDAFLGYKVRELEQVIPPWRRAIRWDDVDLSKVEEEV